jgi:archaemetzincin
MLIPIRIVPLQPVSNELISSIVHPLRSVFQTEVHVDQQISDIVEKTYDDSRAQHNSTQIIAELLRQYPFEQTKILGITSVDLFVPILTYVFGEAQLDGPVCVVSTYRLDDTIYGLPADPGLFFERALKESVHELGHTYGLYHCKNYECAMHTSTAAEDIDQKGATLCEECRRSIGL